jgi:hypothetical protein
VTNKNKCIQIISSISTAEHKSCLLYLQAQHRSEVYTKLVKIYKSNASISTASLIDKLGYTALSDVYIRQMHTRLYALLRAFTAQSTISEDTKKWKAIASLRKENTQDIYDAEISKIDKTSLPMVDSFEAKLMLQLDTKDAIQSKNIRSKEPNLQAVHDALDRKYIFEKLKYSCASLNFALLNNHEYDYGLMAKIDGSLGQQISKQDVVIHLYYLIYTLFKEKEEKILKSIITIFDKNKDANEELKLIYTYTINFVVVLINKGNRAMLPTLFSLYQSQIKSQNIYDPKGEISPHGFKNILALALNLKEHTWTRKFIEDHKEKLPLNAREGHYMFGMSRVYFEMKEYKKCAHSILLSKPMDLLNNLSLRVLQIKALYMLDDYDGVDTAIANCKLFMLRHPSKSYLIQNYKNFVKVMEKVNNGVYDITVKRKLFTGLQAMEKVAEKEWLIEVLK